MQKRFSLQKASQISRIMGLSAVFVMLFLAKAFIFPSVSNTTNAIIGEPTPSESTVTLSIGDGPISLDLSPISPSGTFKESDDVAINVSTNNISGYTLQISSNNTTESDSLISTDDTNCSATTGDKNKCRIASIPAITTVNDYANSSTNNTWGYKPSQYIITADNATSVVDNNTGDNTVDRYFPAPSISGDILAVTEGANPINTATSERETDEYSIKIASRVDTTIPTGTYQNTFIIAAIGNLVNYSVTYNENAGTDVVTNMPTPNPQTGSVSGSETDITLSGATPARPGYYFAGWCTQATNSATCPGTVYQSGANFGIDQTVRNDNITLYAIWVDCLPNSICYDDNGANSPTQMGVQTATSNSNVTLWASNFQRNNYGFLGWSEDADAVAKLRDDDTTNNATIYGPNETISTGNLSQEGMKLYAVWLQVEGNIQNFKCSSLSNIGDVTAQLDTRDDNVYAIAKLADGNCWMIENLRLDSTASIDHPGLAQGYGGVFSGLAASETSGFTDYDTANSRYISNGSGSIIGINGATHTDIGTANSPFSRMPRYNDANTASPATLAEDSSTNIYSYGNYYSWSAAMANTTAYSNYTDSDAADTSLCPDGWQLPLGAGRPNIDKSFANLDRLLGGSGSTQSSAEASNRWRKFPYNMVYTGYFDSRYDDTGPSFRGDSGSLWTSSAESNVDAYFLSIADSLLYPGNNSNYKFYGLSVRCVSAR